MGTFMEVKSLDKGKFSLFRNQGEMFLYSSEHSPHVYMKCDACEATLACKLEDLKYFLKEINFMKCPNCGESALEYFRLDVKMKHLMSALADLDEEDLKYFLKEIKNMKCTDCEESTLEYLRLEVKLKHLMSALADLNEIRKKKEEGHCNLDEED